MAQAVEQGSDLAIITQDNPRREPPQRIVRDVLKGFRRPDEVEVITDRANAIAYALSQAEAGDCVLIAGKGHESHQIVGTREIEHDDCEAARQWLYQNSVSLEMLVRPWQAPTRRLSENRFNASCNSRLLIYIVCWAAISAWAPCPLATATRRSSGRS